MRLVIIGGDAAGMSAASSCKRNSPDVEAYCILDDHRSVGKKWP